MTSQLPETSSSLPDEFAQGSYITPTLIDPGSELLFQSFPHIPCLTANYQEPFLSPNSYGIFPTTQATVLANPNVTPFAEPMLENFQNTNWLVADNRVPPCYSEPRPSELSFDARVWAPSMTFMSPHTFLEPAIPDSSKLWPTLDSVGHAGNPSCAVVPMTHGTNATLNVVPSQQRKQRQRQRPAKGPFHCLVDSCSVRSKTWKSSRDRDRHLWAKHSDYACSNNIPYQKDECFICGRESRKDNLKRHLRHVHGLLP